MSNRRESKHAPFHKLDPTAQRVMRIAQDEAEARGGSYVVSGLLLLGAFNSSAQIREYILRRSVPDISSIASAIDEEWSTKPVALLDDPPTLVSDAVVSAWQAQPDSQITIERLLASVLKFDGSMANSVLKRLGIDPVGLANDLRDFTT